MKEIPRYARNDNAAALKKAEKNSTKQETKKK
jgi:hypothetical protein